MAAGSFPGGDVRTRLSEAVPSGFAFPEDRARVSVWPKEAVAHNRAAIAETHRDELRLEGRRIKIRTKVPHSPDRPILVPQARAELHERRVVGPSHFLSKLEPQNPIFCVATTSVLSYFSYDPRSFWLMPTGRNSSLNICNWLGSTPRASPRPEWHATRGRWRFSTVMLHTVRFDYARAFPSCRVKAGHIRESVHRGGVVGRYDDDDER